MIKYINKIAMLAFTIFFISCAANNTTKGVRTLTNKRGETFTFHGDGTTLVKGPFNEDLGTHRTNNNNPRELDRVQLIKEDDNSVVYVGTLGLKGGCWKCHDDNCKNSKNCKNWKKSKEYFEKSIIQNLKKNDNNNNNDNDNDNDNNNEKEEKELINMMDNHMLKKHDWNKMPKLPSEITSQDSKTQIIMMARVYKKLLYSNIPDRPYCGGWWVLSHSNYLNNLNQCIKSPEQLGFKIICPSTGLNKYRTNIIRFVRDGSIKILSCVTKIGSYYVRLWLENTTGKDIELDFNLGQIFEQARDGIGEKQSLAVFKDHKFNFTRKEIDDKKEGTLFYLGAKTMKYTIKANDKIHVELEAICINPNCGSSNDAETYLTNFIDRITLICFAAQQPAWDLKGKMEDGTGNDLETILKDVESLKDGGTNAAVIDMSAKIL